MSTQPQAVAGAVAGPDITLRVSDDAHPQVLVGHLWRYRDDGSADGLVGSFSTRRPEVNIGTLGGTQGRFFLLTGIVLNMNDDPPTPYAVTADIRQGGASIATLSVEGGSGSIGSTDQPFLARFRFA